MKSTDTSVSVGESTKSSGTGTSRLMVLVSGGSASVQAATLSPSAKMASGSLVVEVHIDAASKARSPKPGPVGPRAPLGPEGPVDPVAPVAPVVPRWLQVRGASHDAQRPFGADVSMTRSAPVGFPCARLV